MTKLEKLYSIIENSREVGVKLSKDVLQQVEELEEGIIKEEILPALGNDIAPRLEPIKGEPISVALSRKTNVSQLIEAKRLNADPEVEHKHGSQKARSGKVAPRTGLCIHRPDGSFIQELNAAATFTAAIKEAGLLKVRQLGIPLNGINIVSTTKDRKYGDAQREVTPGLYVLTHSNTAAKKRILEKINEALKLGWRIEIIQ